MIRRIWTWLRAAFRTDKRETYPCAFCGKPLKASRYDLVNGDVLLRMSCNKCGVDYEVLGHMEDDA